MKMHECAYLCSLFSELKQERLLHREEFIYRINDSPEGMEAAKHRKHMFDGVCNGGQLKGDGVGDRSVDGGKRAN